MDELTIASGCMKAILEKYADPIADKIAQLGRDEWEKFKIDFDVTFIPNSASRGLPITKLILKSRVSEFKVSVSMGNICTLLKTPVLLRLL